MKKCPKCGTTADDDDIYCPECGGKLKAVKKESVAKEYAVRKITIGSILKIVGFIVLIIIIANIFKHPAPVVIAIFLLLLWLNVINKLLSKLFKVELSLGVKILITVIIIFLLIVTSSQKQLIGKQVATQMEIMEHKKGELMEEDALFDGIKQLEKALRNGDFAFLEGIAMSGRISSDVHMDFEKILVEKGSLNVVFDIIDSKVKPDWAGLEIKTIIMYEDGSRRRDKSKWELEKHGGKWKLVHIDPPLSDLVFSGNEALSIKATPQCQNGICLTPARTDIAFGSIRKI